jgi:hypothetical protein
VGKEISPLPKESRVMSIDRSEYFKKYREEHKEEAKARSRKSYLLNKEKILERTRQYYKDNKTLHNQWTKDYYQENKIEIQKEHREYYQNNKVEIRKYRNNFLKNNITLRIRKNLGRRLHHALKGENKSTSILNLIGCSLEELKNHLESQFTNGMSWENYKYDGWHIDHRIPCYRFDLSKVDEQKKCFNYSNLQPLWAKDNFSKNRY